ncbi:MAG: PAS domain S-box protein [Bacteroidales bacterium]|nr:PAS domain S-box protein [Bacteroidales bacterium]
MKSFFFKILIFAFSAAVLLPENVFAQKDSLDDIFYGYIKKYEENFSSKPYVSSRYADSARRFATNNVMDSLTLALSYRCYGRIKYVTRKYPEALQYQLRAYKIYMKAELQNEIATSLVDIAKIYYAQELYDLAQEYCLNVIEICNKNDFAEIKADAYSVLGRVAILSGSGFNEAVFNMKYARKIYDSLNISDKMFDINAFLARAYIHGNSYDSAMKYLNMNFDEYRLAAQKGKIAITYNTCGDIYYETEDYKQALQYYRTARGIFQECDMVYNVMNVKYNIAKVHYQSDDFDNAAKVSDTLSREVLDYENRFKTKEYSLKHKVYGILYNSYLKLGVKDSALKYCDLYARGGDSIFIVKNRERVIDFFISMEGHRQQDELLQESFKKERIKFEEAELSYRRICFILIGIIFLLIAGFMVFMRWYRGSVTENKALTKANALLDKEIQERKRTEADLKSSEEKYRFVFRKMPVGVIQFNEKLVVTSVNDACMQILGIKNKSLIGINVTTVLPPKLFDELRSLSDEKDEDAVIKHELDLKTPDGDVSVEAVLKSYYYNSGIDVGRAGIIMIQDITERKQEEKNEEGRFATVKNTFDMLPDAVFRLDEKADYIFAKVPGLTPEKQQAYLGRNLRAMTDGSLMIKFLVAFNNVKKTGEPQYVEYQADNSPDKIKEARFSLCVDNTVLLTIRDVSKDKPADEVKTSPVKSDREVSKADTEFINGMSTELKEPLEVILRSCEILAAKSTDAEFSVLLREAINAASYANETLSDVLKLSKATGTQENSPSDSLNPVAVAEDVFKIFQHRAAEKNLEYKFTFSDTVPKALEMDEIRVRQILFNLLSNAVKYTEEGGVYLFVSAKNVLTDRADLVFEVKDTGKGLNGMQLEDLFSGSGLRRGLVISKKMADSMKATIEVKSQEGDGSVFVLTVPNLLKGGVDSQEVNADEAASCAKKLRNQDVMKEYVSVIKYAVIPEFKSLKSQISFKELSDFANRFREQSVNCNMEKGVEIADKMIADIKNYDISNIIVDSKKIERYIQEIVK